MVGTSGSGKTTVGRKLAARLGVPFIELDAVFHQPGWTELPREEFRTRVRGMVDGDAWVLDGNYSSVLDLVWARADTVVWFDLSRTAVMRQLIPRTFSRMVSRRELWNGNRESLKFLLNRDESILWWACTQLVMYAKRYAEAIADPANAHLAFIRVRSRAEARALLHVG
jgi:adenylate kinase family enzyme